jgi:hypothetical protein
MPELTTVREAEAEIYRLRKRGDVCLQAGAIEEYNVIQTQIAQLQARNPGAVKGRGEEEENDHRI